MTELLERDAHTIGGWLAALDRDGPAAPGPEAKARLKVAVQAALTAVGIDVANGNWKIGRRFIAARFGLRRCLETV